MKVANEILSQLGGNRFLTMTGVKTPVGGPDFLQFKLPKAGKDKINFVKITLNGKDLYDVEFFNYKASSMKLTEVSTVNDVYADKLVSIFESKTGYAARL